jgi:hypothetical protein
LLTTVSECVNLKYINTAACLGAANTHNNHGFPTRTGDMTVYKFNADDKRVYACRDGRVYRRILNGNKMSTTKMDRIINSIGTNRHISVKNLCCIISGKCNNGRCCLDAKEFVKRDRDTRSRWKYPQYFHPKTEMIQKVYPGGYKKRVLCTTAYNIKPLNGRLYQEIPV